MTSGTGGWSWATSGSWEDDDGSTFYPFVDEKARKELEAVKRYRKFLDEAGESKEELDEFDLKAIQNGWSLDTARVMRKWAEEDKEKARSKEAEQEEELSSIIKWDEEKKVYGE